MGVSITLTPLYGSHSSHHALSHLLTIDNFRILLDCGWTSTFPPSHLASLASVAPSVDLVLLSHPDLAHLGALPYAVAHLGLSAPIFSTLPVWRMGQMFMYDAYLSHTATHPFSVFDLDHVDAAFELHPPSPTPTSPRYRLLKYQQHFPLDAMHHGAGIVITPHAAGHMLGGTVWSVRKRTETLVYAAHVNHRRERHLNPTALSAFSRPSHLVIGATNALTHTQTRTTADLVRRVKSALGGGGNVLVPVDTAGRVVELAVLLHDAWAAEGAGGGLGGTLVVLHELSARVFEFARSMIEWMSDEVVKRFDVSRENLFVLKHVTLATSLDALDRLNGPLVVLASTVSMEVGFARTLFARWGGDARNAVVLVDRPEPGTLYAKLYEHCRRREENDGTEEGGERELSLDLTMKRKEFLQGSELERWREEERARKAREEAEARREAERLANEEAKREEEKAKEEAGAAAAVVEGEAAEAGAAEVGNDNDMEGSEGGKKDGEGGEKTSEKMDLSVAKTKEELLNDPARYEKYIYEQLVQSGLVSAKPKVEMFAFAEPPRIPWDDYGQVVDTERFMIGEDPGEGAPRPSGEDFGGGAEAQQADAGVPLEEIPTKYVEEKIKLDVACQLWIVDCAGLSDGDSLKRLIKDVEPRHVTLIGGTEEETVHLRDHLLTSLYSATNLLGGRGRPGSRDSIVVAPKVMETVDITSHTSVLELRLEEALVSKLGWNEVGGAALAFVDAQITLDPANEKNLLLAPRGSVADAIPESDLMEDVSTPETVNDVSSTQTTATGHPTVYVGTIMLNRMKDVVTAAGMKAEYAGGALCIENAETGAVVLLKKVGTQHIVQEGALSEEYLKVQDLLYKELVIPE